MGLGYNMPLYWEKPNTGFPGLTCGEGLLGFRDMGRTMPEHGKFHGFLSPSKNLKSSYVPNGRKALSVVPREGWAQIYAPAGFLELVVNKKTSEPGNYGKGNLGLGYLGFGASIQDPALRTKTVNAELANDRLAMMAIIGMCLAQQFMFFQYLRALTAAHLKLPHVRDAMGRLSEHVAHHKHQRGCSKMDSQARRGVSGQTTATRLSVSLKDTRFD